MSDFALQPPAETVAIIGMRGRFPGAADIQQFWHNLRNGIEGISVFSEQEMLAAGMDPSLLSMPGWVNAGSVLDGVDLFDAHFFGMSARDAEMLDPQHRLFLECAWESLESAGYDTETYPGLVGAFAGTEMSQYLMANIYPNLHRLGFVDHFQMMVGNDKDHLTTHVSYKLNLRGPSMAVQTACSTSLVAVCVACHSLLTYQCDMALAGGAAISLPQRCGYLYQPGAIVSPDGHCRAFDAAAQGTVGGNGVAIVVLKRLSDALADGDTIHAVIRGSALNNDGSQKVGYTAPSVDGQAQVIAMAQSVAGVSPESISYVEAHGTGTPLGDPIEVAALTQVFRAQTNRKAFCAIGSVKTNVGHLNAAAGVAGLIKTVLALENQELPPSLHYTQPNPEIDFANSPFYVNDRLREWKRGPEPRFAGVSAFGIGGTNAHVVLEEAPIPEAPAPSRPYQLLVLSAKSDAALDKVTENLAVHLENDRDIHLPDVAFTLHVGRRAFNRRRMLVCRELDGTAACTALSTRDPQQVFTGSGEPRPRPVVFLFPGQGAQYVNMGLDLYLAEPTFRAHVDACSEVLRPHLGLDLRDVLYPNPYRAEAEELLLHTAITQPALFTVEYALASLWMEWGICPHAMIGHSIGEYVAACLAGVLSLENALALVAARGHLMGQMPAGAMLAVPLSEQQVQPLLSHEVCLAAVNGPSLCVISGLSQAIGSVAAQLTAANLRSHGLRTSHAFHSSMMDPMLQPFLQQVQAVALNPPSVPFISSVTGTWIGAAQAVDPNYWVAQLRQTVRCAAGLQELLSDPDSLFLEVGPGQTMSTLIRQQPQSADRLVLSSVRTAQDPQSDDAFLLNTLGRLWLSGNKVDWTGFHAHERRRRLPLPTYPFERQSYWIGTPEHSAPSPREVTDMAGWFYAPSWNPAPAPPVVRDSHGVGTINWLVFLDHTGIGSQVAAHLSARGDYVATAEPGSRFQREGDRFTVRPGEREDYDALLRELKRDGRVPGKVLHVWGADPAGESAADNLLHTGFYSLKALAQALARLNVTEAVEIGVVTSELGAVLGDEPLSPAKAAVLGACKVIPQEYPNVRCRSIDVVPGDRLANEKLAHRLIAEVTVEPFAAVAAYRQNRRWILRYEPLPQPAVEGIPARLRQHGVYLITGGLGNIGLALAEYLAREVQAKLVLCGRSAFPARERWEQWMAAHEGHEVSRKIQILLSLEQLGAEVVVHTVDASDKERMREVIGDTCRRFGAIHGVIHGAGNTSAEAVTAVADTDEAACERHFAPKLRGTIILEELLRERQVDFVVLLSSLSAVLGGLGFIAYAAANAFLDAFAARRNQAETTPWISINWDAWQFPAQEDMAAASFSRFIGPEEGVEAFRRILEWAPGQVVVSTADLQARLDQWINLDSVRDAAEPAPEAFQSQHVRPNLSTQYVAPRNPMEQTIAQVWQELLGVAPVGVFDRFFELGGHSLLAIQLVSRLRSAFQVELPVQRLFEAPTIAQLAESIERSRGAVQSDEQVVAELLELVEGLSESELEELLKQQEGTARAGE
jgi:acyl transferase domain-containing protein